MAQEELIVEGADILGDQLKSITKLILEDLKHIFWMVQQSEDLVTDGKYLDQLRGEEYREL